MCYVGSRKKDSRQAACAGAQNAARMILWFSSSATYDQEVHQIVDVVQTSPGWIIRSVLQLSPDICVTRMNIKMILSCFKSLTCLLTGGTIQRS